MFCVIFGQKCSIFGQKCFNFYKNCFHLLKDFLTKFPLKKCAVLEKNVLFLVKNALFLVKNAIFCDKNALFLTKLLFLPPTGRFDYKDSSEGASVNKQQERRSLESSL